MRDEGVILVAGEALVDLVPRDGDRLHAYPGGGPFNVARTIGRLERPVAYLGRISTDRFGDRLRAALEADGVRLGSVVSTDQPTTLAIADVGVDGSATFRFYSAETSVPGLTPADARAALPSRVDMLLTGGLGLVLEPIASTLEGLLDEIPAQTLVAVDPNCRPGVIRDPPAYRARLSRVLGRCDVLKASEEDLAWLHPEGRPVDAARAMLAGGPSVAVVTRGERGATVVTPDREVDVPAPAVQVIDTIGAGDAFSGALLAWWHGRDLGRDELGDLDAVVAATAFACRVAARTAERAGASPPTLAEVTSTGIGARPSSRASTPPG